MRRVLARRAIGRFEHRLPSFRRHRRLVHQLERDAARLEPVEQARGALEQPQIVPEHRRVDAAGERAPGVAGMQVARMEIDDDREPGRQDQPDLVEQHVVEPVAPRAFELQERPGIDGKPHEVEAGAPQRLQLGDVAAGGSARRTAETRTPSTAPARSRPTPSNARWRCRAGTQARRPAPAPPPAAPSATRRRPIRRDNAWQRRILMRTYMRATGSPSREWNAR